MKWLWFWSVSLCLFLKVYFVGCAHGSNHFLCFILFWICMGQLFHSDLLPIGTLLDVSLCKPRRVLGEQCGSQPSGTEIHGHSQWAGQFNAHAPLHIWNLTAIPGEKAMPADTVLNCPSLGETHVLPAVILLEFSAGVLVSILLLSTGR